MINIYNTLSGKKEEFHSLENGKVKIYVCGPTVYDVPHIGHARSAYVFDVVRRYLEYRGIEVILVRNVTDVDDKIIKKAVTELEGTGKSPSGEALREMVKAVAERYLNIYRNQLDMLGITPPTFEPRATENIGAMLELIKKLIDAGYAYVSGGDVYFSVDKFKGYGKLSNRDKDDLIHGVRVDVDEKKRHPLDFALWKSSKPGEPSWKSPWGEGRPGWHIECSAMSAGILGDSFDIHGGGLDLIFPHHENEIAQSEAASGKPPARYWMHNGLLTVNGEKMSKSSGNYITISDLLEKYPDPDIIKLAFSSSHYRNPIDHTDEKMKEAAKAKERILIFFEKIERIPVKDAGSSNDVTAVHDTRAGIRYDTVNGLTESFIEAMDDDFNTSAAISVIFKAVRTGNDILSDEVMPGERKTFLLNALSGFIRSAAGILGLSLASFRVGEDERSGIDEMVRSREKARSEKDYKKADEIRRELLDKGVTIEDTPEGPVWRKK